MTEREVEVVLEGGPNDVNDDEGYGWEHREVRQQVSIRYFTFDYEFETFSKGKNPIFDFKIYTGCSGTY